MARLRRWILSSLCSTTCSTEGMKFAPFLLLVFASAAEANAAGAHCTPALPIFCANVHVGCSGKTDLPTQGFTISPAKISFDDGDTWQVDVSVSDSGTVYRRRGAADWIRVDPAGAFSQRIYRDAGPVMAYGTCE